MSGLEIAGLVTGIVGAAASSASAYKDLKRHDSDGASYGTVTTTRVRHCIVY